jgi:hypothetical protein
MDNGFPPLMDPNRTLPAVLDLNSAHTKFKSTVGVGFSDGTFNISDRTLIRRILNKTLLNGKKISRQILYQYRRLDALDPVTDKLSRVMVAESGLSGQLTSEQKENLKRRLHIALYCDLLL